jgi:hypothetical protein
MIGHYSEVAENLAQGAKSATGKIRENYEMENEDTLSVRFLTALEHECEEYDIKNPYGLDIDTHKLNDSGRNPPEAKFGPDFVIGYSFTTSNFNLAKGIMIQAKRGPVTDFSRMREQCKKMLRWSPDSFVYHFSHENSNRGYRFYPGLQISQTTTNGPEYSGATLDFDDAYADRTTLKFFRLFFEGYVGDHWVWNNLKYLAEPNSHTVENRPIIPDGGSSTEESENDRLRGAKILVISVSEPGEEVHFPFSDNNTVDSFHSDNLLEW